MYKSPCSHGVCIAERSRERVRGGQKQHIKCVREKVAIEKNKMV